MSATADKTDAALQEAGAARQREPGIFLLFFFQFSEYINMNQEEQGQGQEQRPTATTTTAKMVSDNNFQK